MTRLIRRRALLIGNETYADCRFAALPSVRTDVWQLGQVLAHRQIGSFWPVRQLNDLTAAQMCDEISQFVDECEADELALLYVSGHGTRLSQSNGEFHFVTTDTDYDRVAETSVGAGFVNDLLEQCVAPQKVVMIDCCRSGGFSLGFRTADQVAKGIGSEPNEEPVLMSNGVYVLSSSRANELSFAGTAGPNGVAPSAFTGEVVDALRTGKAGRNTAGEISVDELFDFVNRQMRRSHSQIPVKSSTGVDDRIILATCPQGPPPILAPPTAQTAATSTVANQAPKAPQSPDWSSLLEYYRNCLRAEEATAPLIPVAAGDRYTCLVGAEQLLVGDVDEDGCIALPEAARHLVADMEEGDELWTGYPVIYFDAYPMSRDQRVFAPLLIRAIEIVQSGTQIRLRPSTSVLPHPRLAADLLGKELAAHFAETYRPTWHAGQHDKMAIDIRHVLIDDFGLDDVQRLRPDELSTRIETRTPLSGARNVAVLYRVSRSGNQPTAKLMKDLEYLDEHRTDIQATALAVLSPDPRERAEPRLEFDPNALRLVTPLPCNEGQEAVLRSAMSRRLTVATGPPGTGKSQLVVNLVATAIAAGHRVLVASTNNEAVDVVVRRCAHVTPHSIVRTGSWSGKTNYKEGEAQSLDELRTVATPERNVDTALMDLDLANDRLREQRKELADVATFERTLLGAGQARERHAELLQRPVAKLIQQFESTQPGFIEKKATKLARARFFGEHRRQRYLGRWGLHTTEATVRACRSLAEFAAAEVQWRTARWQLDTRRNTEELSTGFAAAEAHVRHTSTTLLDSVVRNAARQGHHLITQLVQDLGTNYEWKATRAALPAIRAWAVTALSTRRFPPDPALFDLVIIDEASQCAIPHILPLLFRARRALIIGDPMQLQHIATLHQDQEKLAAKAAGLHLDWLETRHLSYRLDSSFRAAEQSAGGSLLLNEHYRCHPSIAALINGLFYDGRLTVLTDIRRRPALAGRGAIIWGDVRGHAQKPSDGGSWINHAEIAKVVEAVRYLLKPGVLLPDATIGVVTPYRPQADAIQAQLNHDRIRVGTVHVFQGGECDVMILSLVATLNMSSRSINWINSQENLWNVAITRAKSHLIVIGDCRVWQQRRIGAALMSAAENAGSAEQKGGSTSDELLKRLYQVLTQNPEVENVELSQTVCGHPTDALVHRSGGTAMAIMLDRGAGDQDDPACHLRLMLRQRELRDDPAGLFTCRREPGWTLYDVPDHTETL